jgi:hypothetical protein
VLVLTAEIKGIHFVTRSVCVVRKARLQAIVLQTQVFHYDMCCCLSGFRCVDHVPSTKDYTRVSLGIRGFCTVLSFSCFKTRLFLKIIFYTSERLIEILFLRRKFSTK